MLMIIQKPGFRDYYEKYPTQVTRISNAKDNRNYRQLSSQCFIRIETLCFVFDNDNKDLEVVNLHSVFSSTISGRIGIWKCCFLRRGENRSSQRKTSQNKGENQQQTQPTGGINRTWATLVGGDCSHHCAIIYCTLYFLPFVNSLPLFNSRCHYW